MNAVTLILTLCAAGTCRDVALPYPGASLLQCLMSAPIAQAEARRVARGEERLERWGCRA